MVLFAKYLFEVCLFTYNPMTKCFVTKLYLGSTASGQDDNSSSYKHYEHINTEVIQYYGIIEYRFVFNLLKGNILAYMV